MIRCPRRLPLTPLYRIARLPRAKRNGRVHRRAPPAGVGDPHGALARLDKLVSKGESSASACPPYCARLKGCEGKKPAEAVTRSSEEGEALLARVHQNALSPADAGLVERIIRTHFWLVGALQETRITMKRLRSVLFGKRLKPSLAPEDSSAPSPGSGEETNACAGLEAAVGDADATAGAAPPDASQTPERVKPTGGHRPGTGRLSADAYVGAERIEGRHEEVAGGQRCPGCGQGTL
jgi:hypothetical protein